MRLEPRTPRLTAATCTLKEQYARLHESIEKGESSDHVWSELSRVCYALGYEAEAVRGAQNVRNVERRRRIEMFLIQKGLLEPASESRRAHGARTTPPRSTTGEEVASAAGFLLRGQTPLTVMTATLAFPLVIGVGGFLTSRSGSWLFPIIALATAMAVVTIIGVMARHVISRSCCGMDDPPTIPTLSRLPRAAARFWLDLTIVPGLLILPGLLSVHLGLHWGIATSLLATGGALTPMSFALRQIHDDWRGLSPFIVVPAVFRVGPPYALVLVACGLIFTPALLALAWSAQSDLYLRAAFLGPLVTAPMLLAARLIGRTLFVHRRKLKGLVTVQTASAQELRHESISSTPQSSAHPLESSTSPGHPRRRHPTRLASAQHRSAHHEASERVRQGVLDRLADAVEHSKHEDLTALRAQAQATALEKVEERQKTLTALEAEDQRLAEERQREAFGSEAHVDSIPDLTQIPGAKILRGADRARAGAAAKRP